MPVTASLLGRNSSFIWMLKVHCKNHFYFKRPYFVKDQSELSFCAPFPPSKCLHDTLNRWYLTSSTDPMEPHPWALMLEQF